MVDVDRKSRKVVGVEMPVSIERQLALAQAYMLLRE